MTLHWVTALVASYGYWALFAIAVVEGPIITVIAGFLASRGVLDIALVFTVAVLADLAGDLLLYAIGRSGRAPVGFLRPGPLDRYRIAALRQRFRAQPGRALLFGKLTHGAGFLFLIAAGAEQIPPLQFLWYNLLGTLPKTAAFLALGYIAGAAYPLIGTYLWLASATVFILVCAGTLFLVRRRSPLERTGA